MKTMPSLPLIMILGLVTPLSASEPLPLPDEMSEIWKALYGAASVIAADDSDHDGQSNAAEATAGTNPFDARSRHCATIGELTEGEVRMDIPNQRGKCYQVFAAPVPNGPWTACGDPVSGAGDIIRIRVPRSGNSGFYRVGVSDCDSDGDGLTDWEESQLGGFDRHNGDSFASGIPGNDFTVASEMLQVLKTGLVTANVTTSVAYEKEGTPAIITVTRSSSLAYPFTVFLNVSGASAPTKSSAGSSDFTFQYANGAPVGRCLVIPAGASSEELRVVPLADAHREVPEEVRISIGSAVEVSVTICDAMPTEANQTYYLANLRPVLGANSFGSGTAVLRLSGDNETGSFTLSFFNLGSPVSESLIQLGDGTVLGTIPVSGTATYSWPIRASGSCATEQEVLDALCSARIELLVKTESRAAGEISGRFVISNGIAEFPIPPDAAPIQHLVDAELDRDIVRFLTQATFGPTMVDIATLQALVASHSGDRIAAFNEWIDQQFAMPSPSLQAYMAAADRQEIEASATLPPDHPKFNLNFEPYHYNRLRGWWLLARHAPDQLRERTAFALSEIFVVSDLDPVIRDHPYGTAHYYDMLRSGAFGNYRDLLEGVATHAIMGQYLSHLRNAKAVLDAMGNVVVSPDENLAREIMQLFSIGLVELNPDGSLKLGSNGLSVPAYGQYDVAELSRALTGWSFSVINSPSTSDNIVSNTNFNQGNGQIRHEAQWTHPLAVFPAYHDTGSKIVLGTTIPGGQTGEQDLADVMNRLSSHPNTAPFICRRLIQRFVTANPSAGYLYRVSETFSASGGNFAATIKAILLDPEARSLEVALTTASFGKKREPILRYLAFLRAVDGKSQLLLSDLTAYGYPASELARFPAGTTRVRFSDFGSWPTQTPQSAPSVFNWFLPDHMPAGPLTANGLVSPEFQMLNEYSVFQDTNFINDLIANQQYAPAVPGQELPPYSYPLNAEWLKMSYSTFEAPYLAVLDTNGDGEFSYLDTDTFNNPAAIATACEALLDRIDLILCAGSLKARYGTGPGQPRQIILDIVTSTGSHINSYGDPGYQFVSMRVRIRAALWLVMSSPDCVIQK